MRILVALVAVVLGACAGSPSLRTPVVPLGAPLPVVDPDKDRGPLAGADRSPAPRPVEPPVETRAAVTYRTVTQVVDRPAAAPAPEEVPLSSEVVPPPAWEGYDRYYGSRRDREGWFPVGTIVGTGLGAAIGGHGHHAEGAWVGGTIGMMFDLTRWWH